MLIRRYIQHTKDPPPQQIQPRTFLRIAIETQSYVNNPKIATPITASAFNIQTSFQLRTLHYMRAPQPLAYKNKQANSYCIFLHPLPSKHSCHGNGNKERHTSQKSNFPGNQDHHQNPRVTIHANQLKDLHDSPCHYKADIQFALPEFPNEKLEPHHQDFLECKAPFQKPPLMQSPRGMHALARENIRNLHYPPNKPQSKLLPFGNLPYMEAQTCAGNLDNPFEILLMKKLLAPHLGLEPSSQNCCKPKKMGKHPNWKTNFYNSIAVSARSINLENIMAIFRMAIFPNLH
jgi:hypothetical protein